MKTAKPRSKPSEFQTGVARAILRAARRARAVARQHGTPIYVWENGRVVAKKP